MEKKFTQIELERIIEILRAGRLGNFYDSKPGLDWRIEDKARKMLPTPAVTTKLCKCNRPLRTGAFGISFCPSCDEQPCNCTCEALP